MPAIIDGSVGSQFPTTIGVGNATPSASGAGITFPATQSASTDANTLDDYEEGTFSPTINGTSTVGTATYSDQVGRYTKIGRTVSIQIYITWSSGTGTGNFNIGNLPFTSASNVFAAVALWVENVTLPANTVVTGYVAQNSTRIDPQTYPLGGGTQSSITYDASGSMMISGTYIVA
jgi:hypothetical protein